ncbi:MAG: starvation-sensing protein RspA [Chloroflexi bacterium]|nr:starvation-sensing protein RspA [Chloroflexota bacterium]
MSNVKIRDVRTILTEPSPGSRFIVVKIETSEPGLYGLGDASYRTRPKAVKVAVEDYLRPFLIGKDVADIEDIWQSAYVSSYWRNGPVLNNALSGVDEALWDIKGKMANMPVHDLLGGKAREAAAVYAHSSGRDNKEVEDKARAFMEQGFHHVRVQVATPGFASYGAPGGGDSGRDPQDGPKWITDRTAAADGKYGYAQKAGIFEPKPYIRSAIGLLEHIRNALGWKVELLHDVHERLPAILGVEFAKEVEQFKLFFLEDLFPPADIDWFVRVREQCATPLAIGEIFNNPHEIVPLVKDRLIDFLRARVSSIGGITPARKYAAMAELFGVRTAWQGPGNISPVGHAAHLMLDVSCWNFGVQEGPEFHDRTMEMFPGTPAVRDGYMWPNGKAGLGLDIDEKMAAKYPHNEQGGGHFDNVRRADGSVVRP